MKIDLDKILKQKAPKLSPFIAKPLALYLKRVIHQRELNDFLVKCEGMTPAEFAKESLKYLNIKYITHNLDELDCSKRYLFASNHPFGGLDGIALASIISDKFSDVRVIVNDILMNIEPLSGVFIPVNKHGRQNPQYALQYKQAMASEIPLMTFPAGMCSRRVNGKVIDMDWKPSFIKHAIDSERDIVPIFFDGKLSNFFYNLHSLRTKLGVKANLEMLYLADEMFKQQGQTFNIYFGEPISWRQIKEQGTMREWCKKIRDISYNLKK